MNVDIVLLLLIMPNSLLTTYLFIEGIVVGCVCYMVTFDVQALYRANAKFVILWYLAWCIVANMIFGHKIFKFDSKYYSSQSWKFVLFFSSLLFPVCLLFVRGIVSTLAITTVIAFMSKLCQKIIALLENKGDQVTNIEYIAYVIGIVLSGVLVRAFVFGVFGKIVLLSLYAVVLLVVIYLDALELLLHTEDSWLRYSIVNSFSLTNTIYRYCSIISCQNLYRLLCSCFTALGCQRASNVIFGNRGRSSLSGTSLDDADESEMLLQNSAQNSVSCRGSVIGGDGSAMNNAGANAADLRHLGTSPTSIIPETDMTSHLPPMSSRYMRGCNNDVVEARRRWEVTYKWRVENNIDGLLAYSESTKHILGKIPDIKSCYPHFFHGVSKSNSPVYYEKLGSINIKKLMGEHRVSIDMLLKYNIFMQEYVWRHLEPDDECGKMITVLDVAGIKMSDMMGDTLEYIKKSIQVIQAHYVDRCLKMYIVNAPFYFNMLWQVVSPLLNETTRSKVTIVSSNQREITSNLSEYIHSDQLPLEYSGGNKKCLALGQHKNELAFIAFVTRLIENKEEHVANADAIALVSSTGTTIDTPADETMVAVELGESEVYTDKGYSTPERPSASRGFRGYVAGTETETGTDSDDGDSHSDGFDESNEFFDAARTWLGSAYQATAAHSATLLALPTATALGNIAQGVQNGYMNLAAASQQFVENNDISSIGDSLTQTGDILTRSVTKTIRQAYLGKKNSYYFDKVKQQWVFENDGSGSCSEDSDSSESSGCESSDSDESSDDSEEWSPENCPQAKQLRKGLYLVDSSDEESNNPDVHTEHATPRQKRSSPRKHHQHGSPTGTSSAKSTERHYYHGNSDSNSGSSSSSTHGRGRGRPVDPSSETQVPKKSRREDNLCSTLYSLGLILLDYARISALNGWLWARKHLIKFLQSEYLLTCCKDFGYSIQFCVANIQLLSFYMLWNMILTCSLLFLPMFLYAERQQFGFHLSTTNSCRIIISSGVCAIALLLYGGNMLEGFGKLSDASGANSLSYPNLSKASSNLNQLMLHLRGLRAATVAHFCTLIGVPMIMLQLFDGSASYMGWMIQSAVVLIATTVVICVSVLVKLGVRAMVVKLTTRALSSTCSDASAVTADPRRTSLVPAPTQRELEQLIHVLMDVAAFSGVLIGVIWNPIHLFVYVLSGNGGGAAAAVTMSSPFMMCAVGYIWLYQRSMDLPSSVSKQNLLEIV